MPGNFDHIISLLEISQKLRVKNKRQFRVHINTVVMKPNFKQLVEIASMGKRFGATAFYQPVGIPQVFPLTCQEMSPSTGVEQLVISGDNLSELECELEALINFKKQYGVVGNLTWQIRNISNYYRGLESGKSLVKVKCYAGFNTIHMESDGEFGSCIFMPYVGNIQNISLNNAWVSEEWNKQRRKIKYCSRPCELNCYYPVSPTLLAYEFLVLPLRRKVRSWGGCKDEV